MVAPALLTVLLLRLPTLLLLLESFSKFVGQSTPHRKIFKSNFCNLLLSCFHFHFTQTKMCGTHSPDSLPIDSRLIARAQKNGNKLAIDQNLKSASVETERRRHCPRTPESGASAPKKRASRGRRSIIPLYDIWSDRRDSEI